MSTQLTPAMGTTPRGKVCCIGGGPVGLVFSLHLASKGYEVHVHEKRANDTEQYTKSPPRSVFYALGRRGMEPLELAGVRTPTELGERLGGLTMGGSLTMFKHKPKRWANQGPPVMERKLPMLCFVERSLLMQHISSETQRLHPGRITLHYESCLEGLDTGKQQATFKQADGSSATESYDLLVAADGRYSKTVRLLQQQVPGFKSEVHRSMVQYVGFSGIDVTHMEGLPVFRDSKGLHLKSYNGVSGSPDNWSCIMSLSQHGTLTGILQASRALMAKITTAAQFLAVLQREMPHMPHVLHEPIAQSVTGQTPTDQGASGKVTSLHPAKRVLLAGDCAHAVLPHMGQGCSSGLQDAVLFSRDLEAADYDLDAALQTYNGHRHPEVLALHEMDLIAPARAGQKGALHPVALANAFHQLFQITLAKLRGKDMDDTPFFKMLARQAGYKETYAIWKRDRNLCWMLMALLSALVLRWTVRAVAVAV